MNFNFFNLSSFQNIIQAFSWTLLHSVWQGLFLAIFTGILLILTRKTKPVLRYNLLSGLLLIFIFIICFTFWYELNKQDGHEKAIISYSVSVSGNLINNKIQSDSGIFEMLYKEYITNSLANFCTENAVMIVAFWFLIFLVKTAKAAGGFYYIYQIRNQQIFEAEERWKTRLQELRQKLKINKTVLLFESELIEIPMVTGFLKPMILVPVGFLTNLPISHVEAILLHELAHIRRKDYLINLFQSFAENIFFFNPAVLWISALIREERENCCDDMAISVIQNKISFVNALVLFQEYKITGAAHAIAFAGKRNHLLDRIKRIIYNNNKQLNAMEKLFVTASLIIVTTLSVAFSPPETKDIIKAPVQKKIAAIKKSLEPNIIPVIVKDTIPAKEKSKVTSSSISTIHITRDDKRYEIEEKDGKITELKIDGNLIPDDKIDSYHSEIEPILKEVKEQKELAETERGKSEIFRLEADKLREQANGLKLEAEKMKGNSESFRAQADDIRKQSESIRIDAEKHRKEAEKFRVSADAFKSNTGDFQKQAEELRKNAEGIREQAEGFRKNAEEMKGQADAMRKEAEVMRIEGEKMRVIYEKMQSEFINDLINDGVIKDKNNLSYKLSADELIVNGVKQPGQVHKKMKDKYLKDESVEMVYNWKSKNGYTTGYMKSK